MSRKHLLPSISCIALLGVLLCVSTSRGQMAAGANKFVGNITVKGQIRSDFMSYWNQITAENEHKWASVERNRDQMNWSGGDAVANYANQNGIPWKFHTLIWGSQYPGWITGLSQSEQLAEIEEWYDAVKARYPEIPMIDVVNEAMPSHAPPPFKNALGGDGATGYDYIIKAFEMARERWPNSILMYNDYNNIEWNNDVQYTYDLVKKMVEVGAPIDAIGCQAHDAWKKPTSQVKANLDKLASLGLPLFITEYDIGEGDDNRQKQIMEEQFTMFWTHPKIVGITYWGYIQGSTWRDNTGLMSSTGDERPALTWLKNYVRDNPNPPNDFPDFLSTGASSGYRLSVSTRGQGSVTRSPEESSYEKDSPVTLTATPSEGWVFDSWSGDADGSQNPLTLAMDASKTITASFMTEDGKLDVIVNGTFSSGADSWGFNSWSGSGSGSVENGEYKLEVDAVADYYHDIQLVQPGILLENGKTYRVVFDAYASAERVLNVNVGMPQEPWTTFLSDVTNGESEVDLTTSKQTYSFDFTMQEPTDENSRLEFSVGSNTPTVYIDNASLFEVDPTAVSVPAKKMTPTQMHVRRKGSVVNVILNGATNGSASLKVYNLKGIEVRSSNLMTKRGASRTLSFNAEGLPRGYYIVKVHSGSTVLKSGIMPAGH